METILITGATGLLGSSLVPHLKKCNYKIVTQARSIQADYVLDLTIKDKVYESLEKIQPKVIINLVGLASVDVCEEQIRLAYLTNTCCVENLVNWINTSGANCHLVQISTDQVYGGVGEQSEDEITITNNYAFSKYAAELVASQVPSTVLRTNFVGRSMAPHRESLTDWIYNSIVRNDHVQVLDDIYFSPLSIKVLVEMIELVVKKKPTGVYNLGSHSGMSKAEFVFSFIESLKMPTNTITRIKTNQAKFLKAYRPKDMRMDNTKFENTLGVKLPNLKDLIQSLVAEYHEKN